MPPRQRIKIGNWDYLSITNTTDERSSFVAAVRSENGILAFKCDAPGPNSVYAGFYAKQDQLLYDRPTAHTFDPKRAVTFANVLKSAETFVMHARTPSEVIKVEFDVVGAEEAIVRLMRDCKN
ncbi:MAG: hypothetical protein EXR02_06465 [Rhodospirillales bacterium]|nr:hypothetical protein [Rhodospirillales bacterium]MSP80693.1 hypothetical protein [Rhodospirillales bacterium]